MLAFAGIHILLGRALSFGIRWLNVFYNLFRNRTWENVSNFMFQFVVWFFRPDTQYTYVFLTDDYRFFYHLCVHAVYIN